MKRKFTSVALALVLLLTSIATNTVIYGEIATLVSGDFELDTNGFGQRGDGKAIQSDTYAHSGDYSLYVYDRTQFWQGTELDVLATFKSGVTYTSSLWVYQDSGLDQGVKMSIQTTDDSGQAWNQLALGVVKSDTWTEISGVFTLPDNGALTEAVLYLEADDDTLDFYIDDLRITYDDSELPADDDSDSQTPGSGSWPGLTTGFEEDLSGFTPRIGGEVVEVSTDVFKSGSQSMKVSERINDYDGVKFEYSADAVDGAEYTYDLWVYQDSGTDQSIKLSIEKRLETIAYENMSGATLVSGEWTRLKGTYTLDYTGELNHFSVYLEAPDTSFTFYVDDVVISAQQGSEKTIQEDLPSMFEAYESYFSIGAALPSSTLSSEIETQLVKKHFNSITAENDMKPLSILSSEDRGTVNNYNNDVYYNYAKDNGLKLRGHTLLWHQQTPDWFFNENFEDEGVLVSREVMLQRMDDYIGSVVKAYDADVLYAWDVVNEAIETSEPDNMRNSLWKQVVGPDYVEKAFEFARKHTQGTDVKLFYNDYNMNDATKQAAVYDLVTDLYDKGLIDGIGLQSHLALEAPSVNTIEKTIRLFGDYGLEVQITELDIDIYDGGSTSYEEAPEDILVKQGYRYKELFDMFKNNSDVVTNVTVWGLTDNRSWLNYFPVVRGNWPLIFDKDYQAKYAYYGIMDSSQLPVLTQEIPVFKGEAINDGVEDFDFTIMKPITLISTDVIPMTEVKTLWDEGNIHIYAKVQDTSVDVNDSFMVMMDLDNSKSDSLESDDLVVKVLRDGSLVTVHGDLSNIQTTVVENSDGYVVEISIALESVMATSMYGFDFGVMNGSEQAKWNDPINTGDLSPKRFGRMILDEELKVTTTLKGSATIDGDKDLVWDQANSFNVNEYSIGSEGARAEVLTLWDDEFIYVYATVADPMLSKENANVWEQDSLEIFIDENSNRTKSYEFDDVQYRVNYENEISVNGGPADSTFESATKLIETGYVVEAKIPFNLDMQEEGMVLGFDIQVNDDPGTGVRASASNWSDLTGNGWRSTEKFGVMVLSSDEALVEDTGSSTGSGSSNNSGSNNGNSNDPIDIEDTVVPHVITIKYGDMTANHWAALAISVLSSKGIFEGNLLNEFNPDDNITRAEFTKIVVEGFDLYTTEALENYDDVDVSDWYYGYIASAQLGRILVEDGGDFRPDEAITREEMAVILHNAMTAVYDFNIDGEILLKDIDTVSDNGSLAVKELHLAGIIEGDEDGYFKPSSSSMRGEAAQILYKALELVD